MSHCVASACPVEPAEAGYLLVDETQEVPGMRYSDSIFASLLKPIPRRWFRATVERHGGAAPDNAFRGWDHLVQLLFLHLSALCTPLPLAPLRTAPPPPHSSP